MPASSESAPGGGSLSAAALGDMLLAMRRLIVSAERFRAQAADHLGLAINEIVILSLVSYPTPLTPTELAQALGRNASTITAAIDRLESAGLIGRHPHPTDRRKTILTLSDGGERVIDWLRSFSRDAFAHLGDDDLRAMADTFNVSATAINAQALQIRH